MFSSTAQKDEIDYAEEGEALTAHSSFTSGIEYDEFTGRPINYTQSLWRVQDLHMQRPEERFHVETSPLVECVMERGGGPMEEAELPQGMVNFVVRFLEYFKVVPTKFSSVEDALESILPFLDYTEPYFLFADMPVQIDGNNFLYTYRFKDTKQVLDPSKIEVFKVKPGWKFESYGITKDLLENSYTKRILAGENLKSEKTGQYVTKEDVLDRIVTVLWGPPSHMRSHVDDWLYGFYEDLPSTAFREDDDVLRSMDAFKAEDQMFWYAAAVGAFMWLRSPNALPFLIEYHPIYGSVLRRDPKTKEIEIRPGTQGEAIVYRWDVYTREHLVVEEGSQPGTCENCKQLSHCTKFVNATALFHPICSCGKTIDVEDTDTFGSHGYSSSCQKYRDAHPAFNAFVCQRCLQMAITGNAHDVKRKCSRFSCPATKCTHHAGEKAYYEYLSQRRRLMLTDTRQ